MMNVTSSFAMYDLLSFLNALLWFSPKCSHVDIWWLWQYGKWMHQYKAWLCEQMFSPLAYKFMWYIEILRLFYFCLFVSTIKMTRSLLKRQSTMLYFHTELTFHLPGISVWLSSFYFCFPHYLLFSENTYEWNHVIFFLMSLPSLAKQWSLVLNLDATTSTLFPCFSV